MAQDLSDIIDLTITIASSGITRAGFGTILIGGYHDRTSGDRVSTYTKLADMAEDFETTDLEYIAATAIKSQDPAPRSFKVARFGSVSEGPAMRTSLTAATANAASAPYTFSFQLGITGNAYQDVEYEAASGASNATIMAGLLAAVTALQGYSDNLLATTSGSVLSITSASAGKHFAVKGAHGLTFEDWTADPGVAADLNTILDEDADWYALVLTYKSAAIQAAMAAAIQTMRKVYLTGTQDSDVATSATDDIGTTLHAASYTRTILLFNDDYMLQADAALAGVWMPYDPGSETLKFKTLTGQTPTNLTSTQLGHLRNKKVNYYATYAGVGIVAEGVTCEGKFADLIRFVDWLFAQIQEELFALFVSTPKVPFSAQGITQVEGVIRAVLQRGVNVGGLLPDFTVTVPALEDVSAANKEARNLGPVEFACTSAGAIHGVEITGTVAV